MAQRSSYTCDVVGCGKQRGAVNHWYVVGVDKESKGFHLFTWEEAERLSIPRYIKVTTPFSRRRYYIACGQAHVHALLDKYFSEVA